MLKEQHDFGYVMCLQWKTWDISVLVIQCYKECLFSNKLHLKKNLYNFLFAMIEVIKIASMVTMVVLFYSTEKGKHRALRIVERSWREYLGLQNASPEFKS